MCIKTYEFYIEYLEMEPEKVGQMNISRLSMMVPMLKKIEDKTEAIKQVQEMNTLGHGDFVREVKHKTNNEGKPEVWFNNEMDKWMIRYNPENTHLIPDENFNK